MVEKIPLIVIKRNGEREAFDRQKMINGLMRACQKRSVKLEQIEAIVAEVEKDLYNRMEREVKAIQIGEMLLKHLREIDQVAYVRFASVYRDFRDVSEFSHELQSLLQKK